jgi:hypothetical protein
VGGQLIALAVVAATLGNDGAPAILVAAIAGPVAVLAAARTGERLAPGYFGAACAWVFVLAPFAATAFFVGGYRHTWLHDVLPDLVGARSAGWFALGAAIGVAVAVAPARLAGALGVAAAAVGLLLWGIHPLAAVRAGVHETGWSVTLLEWLPVAGMIGAARRSPFLSAALGGWLVALVLYGAHRGYENGEFWPSLTAALPAIAVLLSSLWLLVPRLRPARAPAPPTTSTPN